MAPGKAFWLIVKNPGMTIDTGPGISNSTSREYAIALHPKWNAIGNPFNFTIPATNLRLKSSGQSPELRAYTGTWNDPINTKVRVVQPFEGYAVFNGLPSVDSLLINPDLSSGSLADAGTFTKEIVSIGDERLTDRVMSHFSARNVSPAAGQFLWFIRIVAQCQQAVDSDNIAAIVSDASNDHDELDHPEPPVIGEYVSIYFPHQEWDKLSQNYCIDVRPEPIDGEIWEFEIKTNIRDIVQLRFEGLDGVPSEFEVWLADDALKIFHNLREQSQYAVAGEEQPKRLQLVVGKSDFITKKRNAVWVIPTTYELSQNFPNPFNPVTTIRYGLPREERVTVKVYNLFGQEVATLVDGELIAAGYHIAIWDGHNAAGRPVTSGVYFVRIHVSDFVQTRKMVRIE